MELRIKLRDKRMEQFANYFAGHVPYSYLSDPTPDQKQKQWLIKTGLLETWHFQTNY